MPRRCQRPPGLGFDRPELPPRAGCPSRLRAACALRTARSVQRPKEGRTRPKHGVSVGRQYGMGRETDPDAPVTGVDAPFDGQMDDARLRRPGGLTQRDCLLARSKHGDAWRLITHGGNALEYDPGETLVRTGSTPCLPPRLRTGLSCHLGDRRHRHPDHHVNEKLRPRVRRKSRQALRSRRTQAVSARGTDRGRR